jgi:hypothetical protein
MIRTTYRTQYFSANNGDLDIRFGFKRLSLQLATVKCRITVTNLKHISVNIDRYKFVIVIYALAKRILVTTRTESMNYCCLKQFSIEIL